MTAPPLDPKVRELLETRLDSFEKVEVVLALHASGRARSAEELSQVCRMALETVRLLVRELERDGMVERGEADGLVQLAPLGGNRAFQELMALYAHDRAPVLSALSTRAVERIRSMAARAFADAFVLRKKRGEDDG